MEQGIYEHNWQYFTRNSLTTLAITLLSIYVTNTGIDVCRELSKHQQFKTGVRKRVIILTILMETVLCLRLIMIWS